MHSPETGILFLCVANSARSQLAEAIARDLFHDSMRIQSAGSQPTRVRAEATTVLNEVGLDTEGQRSTPVQDVSSDQVDLVITLCAEEVCPAFLGSAERLHWPLPDPASDDPSLDEEARLSRFREARDGLQARLEALGGTRGWLRDI